MHPQFKHSNAEQTSTPTLSRNPGPLPSASLSSATSHTKSCLPHPLSRSPIRPPAHSHCHTSATPPSPLWPSSSILTQQPVSLVSSLFPSPNPQEPRPGRKATSTTQHSLPGWLGGCGPATPPASCPLPMPLYPSWSDYASPLMQPVPNFCSPDSFSGSGHGLIIPSPRKPPSRSGALSKLSVPFSSSNNTFHANWSFRVPRL